MKDNQNARFLLEHVQSERELLEKLIETSLSGFLKALDPADFDRIQSMVRTISECDPVLQGRLKWLGGFIGSGSLKIK